MKLQLVGAKDREGNVREFVFKPTEQLNWQAGQYMHYVLPHADADVRGDERWFTNSAAPSEGEVRITTRIDHEHGSSFKRALQALQPGDEIEADGPEGDFVLGDVSRNYIFVAGGIGITPIRSLLTEAAAKDLQPNATVLYANRNDQIPFRDELTVLQSKNPNLTIRYVIEPERLDDDLLRSTLDAVENPLVYISGPEPMMKALAQQIHALGVSADNIIADEFPGYEGI
jgi:ferredoxin-NADP reductase